MEPIPTLPLSFVPGCKATEQGRLGGIYQESVMNNKTQAQLILDLKKYIYDQ